MTEQVNVIKFDSLKRGNKHYLTLVLGDDLAWRFIKFKQVFNLLRKTRKISFVERNYASKDSACVVLFCACSQAEAVEAKLIDPPNSIEIYGESCWRRI